MKYFALVATGILVGLGAYRVGQVLSSDAIAMFLGLVFGIIATLPGAILVLVASRRRPVERATFAPPPPARLLPPPVVVVFEDPHGRRARVEFADGVEARRFLGEGRARLVDKGRRQ